MSNIIEDNYFYWYETFWWYQKQNHEGYAQSKKYHIIVKIYGSLLFLSIGIKWVNFLKFQTKNN